MSTNSRVQVSVRHAPAPPQSVLMVDDDPAARRLAKDALSAAGFLVRGASNAADAVELAAETRFSAAIINLSLPRVDGVRLAGELEQLGIPVVVLTGSFAEGDKLRRLPYAFIFKPFHHFTLGSAVGHALGGRRCEAAAARLN
jgi:two-component system KDP operon response regulator KdpE